MKVKRDNKIYDFAVSEAWIFGKLSTDLKYDCVGIKKTMFWVNEWCCFLAEHICKSFVVILYTDHICHGCGISKTCFSKAGHVHIYSVVV